MEGSVLRCIRYGDLYLVWIGGQHGRFMNVLEEGLASLKGYYLDVGRLMPCLKETQVNF